MASGEDRLIERFFRPLARDPAALGLVDDAAVITPPAGADLVLTTDGIIEGVHFFPDDPADAVARECLRRKSLDFSRQGPGAVGISFELGASRQGRRKVACILRKGTRRRCR